MVKRTATTALVLVCIAAAACNADPQGLERFAGQQYSCSASGEYMSEQLAPRSSELGQILIDATTFDATATFDDDAMTLAVTAERHIEAMEGWLTGNYRNERIDEYGDYWIAFSHISLLIIPSDTTEFANVSVNVTSASNEPGTVSFEVEGWTEPARPLPLDLYDISDDRITIRFPYEHQEPIAKFVQATDLELSVLVNAGAFGAHPVSNDTEEGNALGSCTLTGSATDSRQSSGPPALPSWPSDGGPEATRPPAEPTPEFENDSRDLPRDAATLDTTDEAERLLGDELVGTAGPYGTTLGMPFDSAVAEVGEVIGAADTSAASEYELVGWGPLMLFGLDDTFVGWRLSVYDGFDPAALPDGAAPPPLSPPGGHLRSLEAAFPVIELLYTEGARHAVYAVRETDTTLYTVYTDDEVVSEIRSGVVSEDLIEVATVRE